MKTDIINVSSKGAGMQAALAQAEKFSSYKELSGKNALHVRLLTEEMMGMMRSITGETSGLFWIEDDQEGTCQLHLHVTTLMDPEKREQLLAVSSSGKNEAARGLMGRLRNFFEQGGDASAMYLFSPELQEYSSSPTLNLEWSMSAYQHQLQAWTDRDQKARDMWDELEKSVVTHVADDIKVSIRGDHAEMTIVKKLA